MFKLAGSHSIRWRLALSYAAIALLAALVMGAVLLTILREYYTQRELAYLSSSAYDVSFTAAELTAAQPPSRTLQLVVENLSFLSQARVRLLDPNEQVLADSGLPRVTGVTVGAIAISVEGSDSTHSPSDYMGFISVGDVFTQAVLITSTHRSKAGQMQPDQDVITLASPMTSALPVISFHPPTFGLQVKTVFSTAPVTDVSFVGKFSPESTGYFNTLLMDGNTPYSAGITAEATSGGQRSHQIVRHPFYDEQGRLSGYVELTDGPAYGRDIVNSVAWGWGIASIAAVALAAGAGWFISRRISAPVLALTDVTTRMAQGNLSARADPAGRDELGRLACSFNTMADQVEGTITTLRRFVADAAHELHTPLTALRTNLELAADDSDETARLDFVQRAQAQVERLEALTGELLDLSRLEASTPTNEQAPVDLAALVRALSELYASQAEQAGLSFELDLPEARMTVQGNETHLRRAIGNLLDNAIKFTPEGGAVSVGLHRAATHVEIWVQDTGIGVPPEDLPHLFNRFHRGRNASAYAGSGLGLAIVKAIAQGHGGDVTAESTNTRTRFCLRLPLVR